MASRDAIVSLLEQRGARQLEHPGGTLLDHLIRTSDLLWSWDAPTELVLAGVAHAAYGTDGFRTALFGLDERALVVDAIGDKAEAIVYLYGSCDRAATYRSIPADTGVEFHDRFSGNRVPADPAATRAFVELTVANEVDVMLHNPAMDREPLRRIFARWRPLMSSYAWTACQRVVHRDQQRGSLRA